jgi:hypothetical protein
MKITRRQLVIAAAGSGAAVQALAQTAPPASPDPGKQARDNAEALAKFSLPISTEPAFQFKA